MSMVTLVKGGDEYLFGVLLSVLEEMRRHECTGRFRDGFRRPH